MINKSKAFNVIAAAALILGMLFALIPFWILFVNSFSTEEYLTLNGYSLWPKEFSTAAYDYLLGAGASIGRAYLMSVVIAGISVSVSLVITVLFAYPLSKKDLPGRTFFSFLLFFTMLFNGGLVPTYMVYTNLVNVKDTLAGMIVPYLLMNAFYVIMVRTYFTSSIPGEVVEAAQIDGSGHFSCLLRIVVPMSKPILATIALMTLINYWNNWTNGIYFMQTRTDLYGIQNYLNDVMNKATFLQSHMTSSMIGFKIPNTSVRMAIAVVAVIPLLVAYPFFQKYFVKGITLGSVKG